MIVRERGFLSSVVHMLHDVLNRVPMVPLELAGFALTMVYNCALVGGELVALPMISDDGLVSALLSFAASGAASSEAVPVSVQSIAAAHLGAPRVTSTLAWGTRRSAPYRPRGPFKRTERLRAVRFF